MPVIGFLSALVASDRSRILTPFHRGLTEVGYVENRNVTIEYRFAEGQYERVPALATDLVRRQLAVIAAVSGTPTALAAKAATATIPIVFAMGSDPVASGLVTSLNRLGGNVTGVTFFTTPLKRLELLRELVRTATTIAVLPSANTCEIRHLLQWGTNSRFAWKGRTMRASDRAVRRHYRNRSLAGYTIDMHESEFSEATILLRPCDLR
jgi:putative ABC transport system substrate-binding protein